MDKRTEEYLKRIGESMPKEITDRLVREEVDKDLLRTKERAMEVAKKRPDVRKALDAGMFDTTAKKTLNMKAAHEAEQYLDAKIKSAINAGILPKAKKDEFMRMVESKLKRR